MYGCKPTQSELDTIMFNTYWEGGLVEASNNAPVLAKYEPRETFMKTEYDALLAVVPCNYHFLIGQVFKHFLITIAEDEDNMDFYTDVVVTEFFTMYKAFLERSLCSKDIIKSIADIYNNFFSYINEFGLDVSDIPQYPLYLRANLLGVVRISGNPLSIISILESYDAYNPCYNFNPCQCHC